MDKNEYLKSVITKLKRYRKNQKNGYVSISDFQIESIIYRLEKVQKLMLEEQG